MVDARSIFASGIGRYLRGVLRGLLNDPRFGRLLLLGNPRELRAFLQEGDPAGKTVIVHFDHGPYSAGAEAHWLSLQMRRVIRADVAFFPHYNAPFFTGRTPMVVAVQDLNHFKLPHLYPRWKRAVASRVLSNAVSSATCVLVSSASTQGDLLSRHPHVEEKLLRIPLGLEPNFARAPAATEARGIPIERLRPYMLCVGNSKPHKNLTAAVEALARVRGAGFDIRLVIAGRKLTANDSVGERSRALGVTEWVVELGEVTDAELRGLYESAECLLFPSLYEGFGLPVVEAMAMGTPVVASNSASLPEVVGDAGILVSPTDPEQMAAAVQHLLTDADVKSEYVRRGIDRAADLSGAVTARRTADAIWEAAHAAMSAQRSS